jgi:hypothetical protein
MLDALEGMVRKTENDPTLPKDRVPGMLYQGDLAAIRNSLSHGNLGLQENGAILLATSRVYESFLRAPPGTDTHTLVARMPPDGLDKEMDSLLRWNALAHGWEQLLCVLDVWLTARVLPEHYPPGTSPPPEFLTTLRITEAMSEATSIVDEARQGLGVAEGGTGTERAVHRE